MDGMIPKVMDDHDRVEMNSSNGPSSSKHMIGFPFVPHFLWCDEEGEINLIFCFNMLRVCDILGLMGVYLWSGRFWDERD